MHRITNNSPFRGENALASAIIGSHNITGFALSGQNGEASVLIEGNQENNCSFLCSI